MDLQLNLMVIAFLLSLYNVFFTLLSKCFMKIVKSEPVPKKIKEDIFQLRKELSEISIVDEFAKYTKTERRLNKLQDELKTEVNMKMKRRKQIRTNINLILQGISIFLSIILFWRYRFLSVTQVPSEWVEPFGTLLSWPINQPGLISYPVWFIACSSVTKFISKHVHLDPGDSVMEFAVQTLLR